jgi:hypothetical protein
VEHGDDIGAPKRAEHRVATGVWRKRHRVPGSPGADERDRECVAVALEHEQNVGVVRRRRKLLGDPSGVREQIRCGPFPSLSKRDCVVRSVSPE